MVMAGFRGPHINQTSPIVKSISKFNLGNVWLVDNETSTNHSIGNIQSQDQIKKLTSDLQTVSNNSLLITIDAEGGEVIRLKEKYGFPKINSAQFFGELNDFSKTRENAINIAAILKNCGFNMNLAPVVDLNVNPNCPIIGRKARSFSNDPDIVFGHAKEFILAHREKNIGTCLKHFPGHGSSLQDTHNGFVDVTNNWSEMELIPYTLLIKECLVDSIMTAHIFNRNLDDKFPATLSKKIIMGLLREKLGFNGIIFSDDLMMKAISSYYSFEEAISLALNAGVDVIVQGNTVNYDPVIADKTIEAIIKLIELRKLTEQRIDESFCRIVKLKNSLGLF
jgi:beta-N-acetylhexosaminidase